MSFIYYILFDCVCCVSLPYKFPGLSICILDSSIFIVFILSFGTSIISYNYIYIHTHTHMYCLENENYVETIHIMSGCSEMEVEHVSRFKLEA